MAYVMPKNTHKTRLSYLPQEVQLPKTGETVQLDHFKDSDYEGVYDMLLQAVQEGQSYPQSEMDRDHFESYYLSHDVFVARSLSDGSVLGSFYIKPNFPGRSSHICNAGFLVGSQHRKKGIGEVLFRKYLGIAKDLGYEGSFFNLVYASNKGSLAICRRLGFTEVGVVPKAGKLEGLGYVDAYQFYYDLTTLD